MSAMNVAARQREKPWSGGRFLAGVALIHAVGITLLVSALPAHPELIGMALLAYSFGLRHAFDVDHIAAIDNTVRKMSQSGQKPLGAGFFFSLGHSTVVFLLACGLALAAGFVAINLPEWRELGGIIGTSVSGLFLVIIGVLNLILWLDVLRIFLRLRRGEELEPGAFESQGVLTRFFRPLFRFITKSWHLFPLGVLFGLGFDTASEIALLALSADGAAHAMSWNAVLALPVLFAAGMSLLDTSDGLFMTKAYRWAFASPIKRVYYNMSVTGLSVFVALSLGLVELLQVLTPKLGLNVGIWKWIQDLDFSSLGYFLVGAFALCWAVALGLWKWIRPKNEGELR